MNAPTDRGLRAVLTIMAGGLFAGLAASASAQVIGPLNLDGKLFPGILCEYGAETELKGIYGAVENQTVTPRLPTARSLETPRTSLSAYYDLFLKNFCRM